MGNRKGLPLPLGNRKGLPLPLGNHKEVPLPLGNRKEVPLPLGNRKGLPLPLGNRKGLPLPLGNRKGLPLPLGNHKEVPLPSGDHKEVPLPLGNRKGLPLPLGNHKEVPIHSTYPTASTLVKAGLLLGLPDVSLPAPTADGPRPFGPVAWAAVRHLDPATRQTAALALTALGRHAALDRLDWALKSGPGGWQRRWRKAELRGALADADPEIAILNAGLPTAERLGIWLWRACRRLVRDRRYIAGLTSGGAIGAGLGLGLLRALTAALTQYTATLHFAMNFFWGAMLGAALVLGLTLARPLLLRTSDELDQPPPNAKGTARPGRLLTIGQPQGIAPTISGAALGTVFFGIMHIIVALLIGYAPLRAPLVALLGFVGGAGLSLALVGTVARSTQTDGPTGDRPQQGVARSGDQPQQGSQRHLVTVSPCHRVTRSAVAALSFVLVQGIFIVTGAAGGSLAIVWPGRLYRADLARYGAAWWQTLMASVPGWYHYVALLDAALVGIVLAAGTTAGLLVAARWLARWRKLVERAGE
jgi:hypothetical protein